MSGPTILAIEHVQLAMPAGREDDARVFYAGVLGFAETPKPAELAKRGGCWFELGNVKIHLGVDPDFRPATKAHPALIVSDVAAFERRAKEAGVTVKHDVELPGFKRVHLFDPFGNRVELLERVS